jgi:hypothetical protein
MIGGLAEERRFFGGSFQKLLVLVVDVVAELDGLVLRHPCREIDPGHRDFSAMQRNVAMPRADSCTAAISNVIQSPRGRGQCQSSREYPEIPLAPVFWFAKHSVRVVSPGRGFRE